MEAILKCATVTQKFARDQILSTRVTVDPVDALFEVGMALGLAYPQDRCRDMRVVVNSMTGTPVLELQEDISRHGSPCWVSKEILTTDPQKILEYEKFQEVLRIVKKCAAEKK